MTPERRTPRYGRRLAALAVSGVSLVALACSSRDNGGSAMPTSPGTTSPGTTAPGTTAPGTAPSTVVGTAATTVPTTSSAPTTTLSPEDLRLSLVEIADIESPTALAVRRGDPTLFITSQPGMIYAVRQGADPVPVLDLSGETQSGGEQGLLGLAFSADGGTAYVNRTIADGSGQVEAFDLDPGGTFEPASRRIIITIPHPEMANHNGGSLVLGPDNMLYIGTGDGGGSGDQFRNAQNLTSLLGKILRIDVSSTARGGYNIPADNPFYAMSSKRNEIWAYGLRNPWRFSFDRLTGDLWIGDVGEYNREEIDVVLADDGAGRAANFGWSAYEGTTRLNEDQDASGRIDPVHEYSHDGRSASVIGGFVYRGRAIPGMYGAYLFGDTTSGTISALRIDKNGRTNVAPVGSVDTISSFGEDHDGELYALSYSPGKVYRLAPAP